MAAGLRRDRCTVTTAAGVACRAELMMVRAPEQPHSGASLGTEKGKCAQTTKLLLVRAALLRGAQRAKAVCTMQQGEDMAHV